MLPNVPSLPEHSGRTAIARWTGRIREAAADVFAPATRRLYTGAVRGFADWATTEGLRAFPSAPATVAAYLAARSDQGRSIATLIADRQATSWSGGS